jgi:hypothetical protein
MDFLLNRQDLQLEGIKRVDEASTSLLDNTGLRRDTVTYWATIPPNPPDKNCDVGLSRLGSLCPSRRANARFADYSSHHQSLPKLALVGYHIIPHKLQI